MSENRERSRFGRAAPKLAELTNLPLFVTMTQRNIALPMAYRIDKQVIPHVPEGHRSHARRLIRLLSFSQRYLQATLADDAQRHDVYGYPVEPVTEADKEWARRMLANPHRHVETAAQVRKRKAAKAARSEEQVTA